MIDSKLTWNGDGATKAILDAAWQAILRATVAFHTELQHVLSIPAGWGVVGTTKKGKPKLGKGRIPSAPGEPPRKRTGWLQRHVVYEQDKAKLTTRVGLLRNAIYGLYLELGTRNILPRPWFLATLKRMLPSLQATIGQTKVGDG